MDRFTSKQPSEAYYVEFDFVNSAGSTAVLSSATVTAKVFSTGVDATATITTVASQTISGTSVYVWVKAGADGTDYQITCVATASDGSVYELEGMLLVAALPLAAPTAITGPGLVVPPTVEPVSLAEMKRHLFVDDDTDDELITELIVSAREEVEHHTRRAIMSQTWDYCLPAWPRANFITLPHGNLQSVTSVSWKDADGTETTLALTTDYLVETNGNQCGRVVLPYGGTWPSGSLYPSNPIKVRFICGWTTPALVPSKIKSAVRMVCVKLYESRGEDTTLKLYEDPTVDRLLASWRLWGEF